MSDADYHEGWHDAIQQTLRQASMTGLSGGELIDLVKWLQEQLHIAKEDLQ